MKKLFLIIFVLAVQSTLVFGQQKTGYVNSEEILQALPEAIKAQGQLDNQAKIWYGQIDSMQQALSNEYAAYQKQQATMNESQRKQAEQSLLTKDQELKLFQQKVFGQGGDLFKKQEALFAPIKDKVINAIEEVAKAEGMTFVFDKVGENVLLFADAEYNITYKVLDILKKRK